MIKELGYKYRGKNQWLYFLSFEPGYRPYNLDQDEVLRMTEHCQNLELALQCYEDMKEPVDFASGEMFLLAFEKGKKKWKMSDYHEYIFLCSKAMYTIPVGKNVFS